MKIRKCTTICCNKSRFLKFRKKFGYFSFILIFCLIFLSNSNLDLFTQKITDEKPFFIEFNPQKAEDPININGNTELDAFCTKGNGSIENPYIIENLLFNDASFGGELKPSL